MSPFLPSSACKALSLLVISTAFFSPALLQAQAIWNGGSATSDNWSDVTNWGSTVPTSGSTLVYQFSGSSRLQPFNDLLNLTATSIAFNSGAGSFTLGGNAMTLNGNIGNNSSNLQTIDLDLVLSASAHTFNSGGTATGLIISGDLSGEGGFTKSGASTLTLSGNNSYEGATTISAGLLVLAHDSALGSTSSGTSITTNATLQLDGVTITGETLTLNGLGAGNTGALRTQNLDGEWAGTVILGSGKGASTAADSGARLGTTGTGVLTVSGNITDLGGEFDLVIRSTSSSAGKIVLSGANTYRNTHILVGVVQLAGGDNRLPVGTLLEIGNTSNTGGGAILDLNGVNQEVAGLRTVGGNMTQTVTNTNDTTTSTLTVNHTDDYIFGSNGTGGKGTLEGNLNLVKSGTGTLTLRGTTSNTYTGTTTINGGTLVLEKSAAEVIAIGGNITIGNGLSPAMLRLGQNHQIADTSIITFNGTGANAGIFRLNGKTEQIAGIVSGSAGAGIIENEAATNGTLILGFQVNGTSDVNHAFTGLFRDGDGVGTDGSLGITLSRTGTGTGIARLTLNSAHSHSGMTTIGNGTALQISHSQALGLGDNTTTSGTVINNGGRLELSGGVTISNERLTLNGPGGSGNTGALRSMGTSGQVNTWTGDIVLGSGNGGGTSGTRVGALSGTTLRLLGQISGTFDLGIRSDENVNSLVSLGGNQANTWRNTYVVVGRLRLEESDDRLPTSTVLTLGNSTNVGSAEFDLNGKNQTIGGLADESGTAMSNVVTNRNNTTASTLTINTDADKSYSFGALNNNSLINGNLALVKTGLGRQLLGGANGYSGSTTVTGGILQVGVGGSASARDDGRTGSGVAGNLLTVQNGGMVIGTGSISGVANSTTHRIDVGGSIAPGDYLDSAATDPTGLGTLDVMGHLNTIGGAIHLQIGGSTAFNADLALFAPGSLNYSQTIASNLESWESLASASGRGDHDLLNIDGQLLVDGTSIIHVSLLDYNPVAGDVFDLIDWLGSDLDSAFNVGENYRNGGLGGGNLNLATLDGGLSWDVSQFHSHGILMVVAVPEPGRMLLLGLGLGALWLRRRHR